MIGGFFRRLFSWLKPRTDTQRAAAKLAVQYATLKAIDGREKRASQVLEVVSSITSETSIVGVLWLPEELKKRLHKLVPWGELDDADRLLVTSLLDVLMAELEARVPTGDPFVPPAALSEVLGWVRDAAQMAS